MSEMHFMGLGCDVEDYARLGDVLQRRPAFLKRWFTPIEQQRITQATVPEQEACLLFCLKEATIKALWRQKHLSPSQIEIDEKNQAHLLEPILGLHLICEAKPSRSYAEAWVQAWN
jgi:phosphopantetheine--protein transferase-like protein